MMVIVAPSSYFNPRSREGSDHNRDRQLSGQVHFNPRSREGSDLSQHVNSHEFQISIHAPVKGATERAEGFQCA